MTSSALASRYAHALVDVVTGKGAPEQTAADLRSFQAAMEISAELRHALSSPAVPSTRKKAVIARIGDALGISRIARNFLFVLVDHRRIANLREILDAFEVALDERLGFSRAEVVSALELNPEHRAAIEAELSHLTGKKIRSKFSVDPSLIGGIVARLGSTVYDGSVRGRLESLGRRLTAE